MLTPKERSNLRSIASREKPIVILGKNALSDTALMQINEHLFCKELIKIKVLKACELSAKELIGEISEKLFAEPVCVMGNIITIYKRSEKENIEHIVY